MQTAEPQPPGVTPAPAIEVHDLFKSYGDENALRGISFTVERGEVFALLGANGAGKTTTLEILEGHRRRSGGRVTVLGYDPERGGRALRERIGVVLQSAGIDAELTVGELLSMYASWYPQPLPADEVLQLVSLEKQRRARVGTLSGGQQRRVDLALALVGDPELIFLDEPTTGFDPRARREAWELIDRLRQLGRTIILTSHYLDEVQHLADRMIVLVGGRIVAEGTPSSLGGDAFHGSVIRFQLSNRAAAQQLPVELSQVLTASAGEFTVRTTDPTRLLLALCQWAVANKIELRSLEVMQPSLEDVYLELINSQRATAGEAAEDAVGALRR
jgi:ABC-2 type transport system ATP-binding protein